MSPLVKVVLAGDEEVGKSSIVARIKNNTFSDTYIYTMGAHYTIVDINTNDLQIWDTAGKQHFDAQTYLRDNPGKIHISVNLESYYSNADVVLYVYDMTNKASFDYLDKHIADVQQLCPANTVQYLVGTKSDKENHVVSQSDVDTLVTKFNLKADYQVSSKSGESVKTMFDDMFEEGVKTEMTLDMLENMFKKLEELEKRNNDMFEREKERIDKVLVEEKERFDKMIVEEKERCETSFTRMETSLAEIKTSVTRMETSLAEIKTSVTRVGEEIDELGKRIE